MNYECYASCSFGIEAILAKELKDLSALDVRTENALVRFRTDTEGIARTNLWLRTADRVYIVLGRFHAETFDELFENIKRISFEKWFPADAAFPVAGNAVQSKLMSVSDMQKIAKKAIVAAMGRKYAQSRLPENGARFQVFINNYKDEVTIALNTSGAGLNRRGYRSAQVEAPLRENLAAALIDISRWKWRDFFDPMCGSGTIAIEAAMMACDMAPGLHRHFDAEFFSPEFADAFAYARQEAKGRVHEPAMEIHASDRDQKAVEAARRNASLAGVEDHIIFSHQDIEAFSQPSRPASIICNPPYAKRIGERAEVDGLYRLMGSKLRPLTDTVKFFLCASPKFELFYGQKADKKRKLYNGSLECCFYQYYRHPKG